MVQGSTFIKAQRKIANRVWRGVSRVAASNIGYKLRVSAGATRMSRRPSQSVVALVLVDEKSVTGSKVDSWLTKRSAGMLSVFLTIALGLARAAAWMLVVPREGVSMAGARARLALPFRRRGGPSAWLTASAPMAPGRPPDGRRTLPPDLTGAADWDQFPAASTRHRQHGPW